MTIDEETSDNRPVIAGVVVTLIVVGVLFLLYLDSTSDPCGDEKREAEAYNIALGVPAVPLHPSYENQRVLAARYPELWNQRDLALSRWDRCLSQ